jgi:hypothetical protein
MTRAERLALIEKLRAEVDASTIELAERRQQRELNGEYFDDLPQQVVTKSHDDGFDVQAAIADQLWQQRNFQTRAPQPQSDAGDYPVTWRDMGAIADDLGEDSGKQHAELKREIAALSDKVAKLETELHLVKALAKGELTLIGKRDAA